MKRFLCEVYRVYFAVICQKIEQKVRFQKEFEQKPCILQRQFSQNVTLFMGGTWSKREILLIN